MIKRATILFTILSSVTAFSQFTPDYTKSYYDIVKTQDRYYDSLEQIFINQGNPNAKLPGGNGYSRWKQYWEPHMVPSGSFEVTSKNMEFQKRHRIINTGNYIQS